MGREAVHRGRQPLVLQRLASLRREHGMDLRRTAVRHGVADHGIAGQGTGLAHGAWVSRVSLTKCQVRVMTSISASRAIRGGNGGKEIGKASCRARAGKYVAISVVVHA